MRKIRIKGSALIVAVMISVVFAIIVSGLVFLVRANTNEVFKNIEETRLFYEAEAEAKLMLKRLSIPANYSNSNYKFKETVNGISSGVKVAIETVVNSSGHFIVSSTATKGKRSVTITISPESKALLGSTLISMARFGGVFRPGFAVYGDIEMTGKPRITLGKNGSNYTGPEFYGIVNVNMNNPYNFNTERAWWEEFNSKYWSAFAQAGVHSAYLPYEIVGSCNFSKIAGTSFSKGLLIAENIENNGGKATKLPTDEIRKALMSVFKGDLDLSKSFNSDAPALNPAMLVDSYYNLTKDATRDLTSSTTNKILPFVADVTSGKNSRQNVKIEFKDGEALITVLNKDLATSTPLKISQANTKVLVIPKEYGDVYVKGEVSSNFTLVTEKDNIIIEDDLYTSDYSEFLNTKPTPETYTMGDRDHAINKLKTKNSTAKLALIPAHNDSSIIRTFKNKVGYNGSSTTLVNTVYDSFTNESFYSGDLTTHTGAQSYLPTKGTVKIVKNAATDNSSDNSLLLTAAIYSKNSAMTTFEGESGYENLVNQPTGKSSNEAGAYNIIEKNWHDKHDADNFFTNYNNLIFVGSYLGYDFPATYRTTGSANKGLRPLYISAANFRNGDLPPGFSHNAGGNSSAKFKPDKNGLIAFVNLIWDVKR